MIHVEYQKENNYPQNREILLFDRDAFQSLNWNYLDVRERLLREVVSVAGYGGNGSVGSIRDVKKIRTMTSLASDLSR